MDANPRSDSKNPHYRASTWSGETICFLSDCWPCRAKELAWRAAYSQEKEEKICQIDDKTSGDALEGPLLW